jgi:hypothetical protein
LERRGIETSLGRARHVGHLPVAVLVEPTRKPPGRLRRERGGAHPEGRESLAAGERLELPARRGERRGGSGERGELPTRTGSPF